MSVVEQEASTVNTTRQVVVFTIADEVFAADIGVIREVIKLENITPVPSSHQYIAGIVNIRGKIVPVMDLGIILKVSAHETNSAYILLIDTEAKDIVGMIVNKVSEIRHFPTDEIKAAPKLLESKVAAEFISGVILPKSGEDEENVILLIDLEAIINKSVAQALEYIKEHQEEAMQAKEESLNENSNR